jgi:HPt (histidine-containing phosphotransfer) domain-containing protein
MSEAVLDAAVLDDLIEHIGAEAAHEVIELFIGESRELAASIGSTGADRETVRRAAHSLKSSAGQLGASALAAAALAVEAAAETGSPELPGCIAALVACAAQTETALAVRLAA